jgi:hypothetical protein
MPLIYRGFPTDQIMNLKVGDFFDERKIIRLCQNNKYIKIVTEGDVVYTAHFKSNTCTIHKRTEPTKFERRHVERKCRVAEQRQNKEK